MKLADLKPGDRLTGFTFWGCVPEHAVRIVCRDETGLFVKCKTGQYYLDGQQDEPGGDLVNVERAP